ncbi:MAG TPA: tetratricopeptide repeat protein [Bryobacteraceae bacterium]|jgi:tetratricopeptide (TPR) repeat protein|nr:tetratricopeptide repeat protein [Bryobacteraceae bacterium]
MAFCALIAVFLFAPQQDFLAQGLKALDANQPAAAEPLLRQAVQADAKDFSAHFNLALALSLQQKDDEAVQEFRRTLELKPGLYQADLNLGLLLLRDKHPAEAAPVLKDALDGSANSPQQSLRVNLLYSQALYETGDFAQAEQHYRAAADLDPKSADAQAGLARSLLRQSKLSDAAEHFRSAAAIDPRYKDGLLDVAAEYEKSKMIAEAIAIYQEFPENAAARERRGQLLAANGNFAAAIPGLEAAVKASPTLANRLALADAYKMNKQMDKEIEQLQLAVVADPANYDARMYLGRELRDQRKFIPAAQQFATAARLRPDSVKAWNELANVLVVNEDYAGGLAALDHVRALGKEVPGDFFYRAIALEKLKQPKPAMEAYRQFLASDGGKMPDQEFQARQRIRIIESELNRR